MGNVLDHEQQQQILALGRLGWTLRRIAAATGVRRETVSAYLRAAGLAVRGRGRPRRSAGKTGHFLGGVHRPRDKTGHFGGGGVHRLARRRARRRRVRVSPIVIASWRPWPSAATPWRSGRTWWTSHGFTARYASVRRFVSQLRAPTTPEARVVITTAPGEEAQVDYGDGPMVRDPPTRQVPAHAALRLDAGLLPQSGAPADVAVERADLGRAPRARVSAAGRRRRASSSSTT